MMSYPIVLFDADETLFDFSRAERMALENTCKAYGIPCGEAVVLRYHEINQNLWKRFESGGITQACLRQERFETLFAQLGVSADCELFNHDFTTQLSKGSFLIDGALELCKALYNECAMHIVTNGTSNTQISRLEHSALRPYIQSMFISEEIGFAKPCAEFFDYVFNHLGITDRSQAILLGDSLTADMQGGKNAGIATCWFAPDDAVGNGCCDYRISKLSDFIPIAVG
ncbi:YjjG family noncanonical pyrimidine nucleotidase [Oscillospiraceae bacterium PP1C4]